MKLEKNLRSIVTLNETYICKNVVKKIYSL